MLADEGEKLQNQLAYFPLLPKRANKWECVCAWCLFMDRDYLYKISLLVKHYLEVCTWLELKDLSLIGDSNYTEMSTFVCFVFYLIGKPNDCPKPRVGLWVLTWPLILLLAPYQGMRGTMPCEQTPHFASWRKLGCQMRSPFLQNRVLQMGPQTYPKGEKLHRPSDVTCHAMPWICDPSSYIQALIVFSSGSDFSPKPHLAGIAFQNCFGSILLHHKPFHWYLSTLNQIPVPVLCGLPKLPPPAPLLNQTHLSSGQRRLKAEFWPLIRGRKLRRDTASTGFLTLKYLR